MNEFLAELYGTREAIGAESSSDVEKLAEAQILDNVLQSEGIDVDQLDDGTILKLAHEIFGDESELVKAAMEGEGGDEGSKKCEDCGKADCECPASGDAEKNAADADLMGRIMAHAYVNELNEIEKDAGVKDVAQKAWEGAKGVAGKVGKGARAAGEWAAKPASEYKLQRALRSKAINSPTQSRLSAALEAGKRSKAQLAAGGGTLAAGGAAAALASKGKKDKGKKKAASALDTLAEQRALAILAENGIEPAGEETKLASAIEERAWEMLAEAGYVQE